MGLLTYAVPPRVGDCPYCILGPSSRCPMQRRMPPDAGRRGAEFLGRPGAEVQECEIQSCRGSGSIFASFRFRNDTPAVLPRLDGRQDASPAGFLDPTDHGSFRDAALLGDGPRVAAPDLDILAGDFL